MLSSWAEINIIEYSSNFLIPIHENPAKIRDGTHRIIHHINISQYNSFLDTVKEAIKIIPPENTLLPLLEHEFSQTLELIESIKPLISDKRHTRSIDALGTVWKYIAGTPDHEDFEIVTQNMNTLNRNNNKQTIINSQLSSQINKLISVTNTLTNRIKKNDNIEIEVIMNLQTKLRLIKEEVINVKYALQYAKLNILNSILLNRQEIKIALEDFKKDNIPFQTIEEVLSLSEVAILYNNLNLLYLIKIPITTDITYEDILLKPVKKNNKIIKLPFNEIIRFQNVTYGIKSKSKTYNYVNIYDKNSLTDISNTTCIPKILNSLDSSCDFTTAYHSSEIEIIAPGLILLNDFHDDIIIKGERKRLNGTYIIKFNNETITAKGSIFSNFETTHLQTKPTLYQPTPMEQQNIKILSLEALEEMHLNNTQQIEMLKTTTNAIGISTISFILIAIVVLIAVRCLQTKKVTLQIQEITKPSPETHTNAPLWSSPQTKGGRVI